ncbi:ABC transporter type 1, transmembrane domain-containing protein, partial [Schizophyllum fasciatum]
WGWVWCVGLFVSTAVAYLLMGQLWSISIATIQVRIEEQMNSVLYAKTLVRKDVAGGGGAEKKDKDVKDDDEDDDDDDDSENADFTSRAQVLTLMTTDVERVSDFAWYLYSLLDSPIEIVIGSIFLYHLLGTSSFVGLAVMIAYLPLNHFAGKVVIRAQDNLMHARDERVSLVNEVLGAIRMLKFMAWERSFEKRVIRVRDKEIKYQKMTYMIEV